MEKTEEGGKETDPQFLTSRPALHPSKKEHAMPFFFKEQRRARTEAYAQIRYIALQLTLSGRSSGAEYTCYQSGHIPNHSTIADQLLPRKVPRSTNLSYSTLRLRDLFSESPVSYPGFSPRVVSLHPFPPPCFHPHPLPNRQSTCTAAFVVDGAVFTSA